MERLVFAGTGHVELVYVTVNSYQLRTVYVHCIAPRL